MLPFLILVAAGAAEAAPNATSRRLSVSRRLALTCPDGYYDKTNGNAYWWACGWDNPSAPYGTRGNCAGGPYTDIWCSCACVPKCASDADCSANQMCQDDGRCVALPTVAICAGDADTWDAGWGDCSTYGHGNFDFCTEDFSDGYYASQVCPQCESCVSVQYCTDDSSRRRSGRSCSTLAADGHCSGGRRRTSGGEAEDTCRKTCSLCGAMAGPAAACPSWKLAPEGQSCSQSCGAGNCVEGYYPWSYNDMNLVASLAGSSCPELYYDYYPESPCLFEGSRCFWSDASADRCDVVSDWASNERFCCCKHEITNETKTSTTVTTETATTTATETSSTPSYSINCTALSDSATDCATRMADSFPLDYCAVGSNKEVCQQSCCGKAQGEPIAGIPPQCQNLLDFWFDCEIRIDSFYRDCKDYCSIAGGCAFTCCVRENTTGPVISNSGLAEVNCSGNVTDYWQDCEVRIANQQLTGIDLCAVEHTRRGCEKTCCSRPPPAPVEGCEDLEDLWHDCDVRIWDRFLDGQDYCSHPASRCGCQLTCCKGNESGPVLLTGTNCSDPAIEDLAPDCAVRLADREGDGTSYCAVPMSRKSCEKTCCGLLDEPETPACEPDLEDIWPDCEQRIQDRELVGQDYCAIKFDRDGCQRTCCGLGGEGVVETPGIVEECSGTEEDTAPDCAARIRDRFDDGLDYCNSGNPVDRDACLRSCCLELGLPVVFTVTIEGLSELDSNTLDAILEAVADEAGVDAPNVSVEVFDLALPDLSPVGARRLQAADAVSAEISVSPPPGLPPQSVANRIDTVFALTLVDEIRAVVPEEQQSGIAITQMTRPSTATIPTANATNTTNTTDAVEPAPTPAPLPAGPAPTPAPSPAGPAPTPAPSPAGPAPTPGPSPAEGDTDADASGAARLVSYAGVLGAIVNALMA